MALGRRKTVAAPPADEAVPPAPKVAAAYSWRILVIVGVIAVLVFVIMQFRDIVVPFFVAVLLAALLVPFMNFLVRKGWPRWLAIVVAMVGTLAVIAGLIVHVVLQVRAGYPDPTAFERKHRHFEAGSDPAAPRWYAVDVQLERRLARVITLAELKAHAMGKLAQMVLLQRGSRLSVMPVSSAHFAFILSLE